MRAQIRRYFYAEHWKVGTIASELGVHPDAVRNAIEAQRLGMRNRAAVAGRSLPEFHSPDPGSTPASTCDPHLPDGSRSRLYRQRGPVATCCVRLASAQVREPFLRLQTFPGEQAQVDWAHFGHVMVGRARRALSCFVMTLSYSRALYLEFFFDQTTENFLRGHVHAFQAWNGQPRVILYDNLKSRCAGAARQSDSISILAWSS